MNSLKQLTTWLLVVFLFSTSRISYAESNFITIPLPEGVTVELPKNWEIVSDDQRITINASSQAKIEAIGSKFVEGSGFMARYYVDQVSPAGVFGITYNQNEMTTQSGSRKVDEKGINGLDAALHQAMPAAIKLAGGRLLEWLGTTKQSINGATAFVTEFRQSLPQGDMVANARQVRIFNGKKSFTIDVFYREDQGYLLKPICDRIISSIRI